MQVIVIAFIMNILCLTYSCRELFDYHAGQNNVHIGEYYAQGTGRIWDGRTVLFQKTVPERACEVKQQPNITDPPFRQRGYQTIKKKQFPIKEILTVGPRRWPDTREDWPRDRPL
jgi:hypothetical protein